jgi:hypothetical protein
MERTEPAAEFLAEAPAPIREHVGAAEDLPTFLAGAGGLTLADRKVLVEQALVLFEQNYVHLPLKAALHAVNPVQRLRLLGTRLERQTEQTMDPEWMFHAELSRTFHSVRDLHTNYTLPAPYNTKIAFLPFLVEEYFEGGEPVYVVSRVMDGFSVEQLEQARVFYWNGIPIHRAVELNAARFAGSNEAARHARGVESLTLRPLRSHLPPDEEWVDVGYVGEDGVERELRQKWLVTENLPPFMGDMDAISTAAASLGLDIVGDDAGRARALLFAPAVVEQAESDAEPELTTTPAAAGEEVPTSLPKVFRARSVETASGTFGHLRIFTFGVRDPQPFLGEFIRLITLLPQEGLILDVRGNPGGHIHASEFTLQTLTPHRITPEPVQFISTPLNLRVVERHKDNPTGQIDLGPWFKSLDQASEIGATFSQAVPMTPEDGANAVGQVYQGPVVLVTDGRCYSATDIFAAGFQDHDIGPVLGVDGNTGAGGANVWEHGLLKALLEVPSPDPDTPYAALPSGANMRVSIRRTLRVGARSGTPLEDLGVVPAERHFMTRDDLLAGNKDLLDRAGALLAAMPVRRLDLAVLLDGGELRVDLTVANVDRADIYVDGRPRASVDTPGAEASVTIDGVEAAAVVRAEGFADGKLVAARTVAL